MFDAQVPANLLVSTTLIEVKVTKDITGTAGGKSVEVHTGDGSLSNSVTFTVK